MESEKIKGLISFDKEVMDRLLLCYYGARLKTSNITRSTIINRALLSLLVGDSKGVVLLDKYGMSYSVRDLYVVFNREFNKYLDSYMGVDGNEKLRRVMMNYPSTTFIEIFVRYLLESWTQCRFLEADLGSMSSALLSYRQDFLEEEKNVLPQKLNELFECYLSMGGNSSDVGSCGHNGIFE